MSIRNRASGATPWADRGRATFVLGLSIFTLCSCGYFDLFNPFGPPIPDTSITWEKQLGGADDDAGLSIQLTTDGGYIIAGYTESYGAGGSDVWLVKTDADGEELWSWTFGGAGEERGRWVRQTSEGGYIVVGYTDSIGAGGSDVWLIKTDVDGNEEWSQTYGGSEDDGGWCVEQTDDGGYVVTGDTCSFGTDPPKVWLIKTDVDGIEEWSRTYGAGWQECGYRVLQIANGGYVIGGKTASVATMEDAYLLETDAFGDERWSTSFGGDFPDCCTWVEGSADGGYLVAGYTHSFGAGDFNAWLIKTNVDGIEEWSRTYGGNGWDRAECVRETPDGGYILGGMTRSVGPWEQAWLIKTDAGGNEEWSKAFGGDETDWGTCVQQTADGGYILTGYTDSFGAGGTDLYLIYYEP